MKTDTSVVQAGARRIGAGAPVYVIAEAGSNHNGSFEQALRLIDAAKDAGVDAVKFQNFTAATLYPKHAGRADYLKGGESIYELIERMEMPAEWVPKLAAASRERGLDFVSSPFDEASVDLLEPYVELYKIASYEMTHAPLLRHAARKGKPMIVSTGTATLDEVRTAVDVMTGAGNDAIVLMQCTASYPTPPHAVNARAIVTLREATGRPVGLSDHSRDPVIAPVVAVALGACVIEKHFTLSNDLPGPDHKFAVEPDELKRMVVAIREAEAVVGHGRKEVLAEEEELRSFARRAIFTTRALRAGETIGRDNIAVLRTGKLAAGLAPDAYDGLLGRRAARDLAAETPVRAEPGA